MDVPEPPPLVERRQECGRYHSAAVRKERKRWKKGQPKESAKEAQKEVGKRRGGRGEEGRLAGKRPVREAEWEGPAKGRSTAKRKVGGRRQVGKWCELAHEAECRRDRVVDATRGEEMDLPSEPFCLH